MGESTKSADAVDKLINAVGGKFNKFRNDAWKRTAQSIRSMRHSGVSEVLEERPCPQPAYIRPRTNFATSRHTRAVTRSQVVDETATQPDAGERPPDNQGTEDQP